MPVEELAELMENISTFFNRRSKIKTSSFRICLDLAYCYKSALRHLIPEVVSGVSSNSHSLQPFNVLQRFNE